MEETLILLKPDGVQRGLVGEVIRRFESRGCRLTAMRMLPIAPKALIEAHYEEHRGKPFFADLVNFMLSGPIVAMIWQGTGIILAARTMMGKTDPLQSAPGTIRGDFAISMKRNIIHGSDSLSSSLQEIALWFPEHHRESEIPRSRL